MSQHDMTVDNGSGVAVRADINLAIKALASQSSGASAPSPTFPAQMWADTGTGRMKQRDAANANWVDKGPIDGAMAPLDSPVFTGQPQGFFPCIVGGVRNGKLSVTAASATATFTADEVVVKAALGGLAYRLSTVNKGINLAAANGAGAMDTGAAPASGWVAIYAIYNPVTFASALLAVNATSVVAPEVYGGVNMPTGYTASALIAVWRTTAGGLLSIGYLDADERRVYTPNVNVLSTATQQGSLTSLSIATAAPPNAKTVGGYASVSSSSAGNYAISLSSNSTGLGMVVVGAGYSSATGMFIVGLVTMQTIWYTAAVTTGTMTANIYVTSYTF